MREVNGQTGLWSLSQKSNIVVKEAQRQGVNFTKYNQLAPMYIIKDACFNYCVIQLSDSYQLTCPIYTCTNTVATVGFRIKRKWKKIVFFYKEILDNLNIPTCTCMFIQYTHYKQQKMRSVQWSMRGTGVTHLAVQCPLQFDKQRYQLVTVSASDCDRQVNSHLCNTC